ncbi:MAG: hypothetical protein DBP02_10465, partial [gamma proteobacterium symbiont of Ctena orbiculata]
MKPKFDAADEQAEIPEKYRETYEMCKASPSSILPKYIPFNELPEDKKKMEMFKNGYIEGKLSNDFSLALNILEYRELFQQLPLNENDVLKFISLGGTTPISVLYYALLPKVAERLPGFAGNLIVQYSDIDRVLVEVEDVLKNLNEEAWDRARRYISVCTAGRPSTQDDEKIEEIFQV